MRLENYIKLCEEHRDLTTKIIKLQMFLDSHIEFLDEVIAGFMIEQYKAMRLYQMILSSRMAYLHIDIVEDDYLIKYKFLGKTFSCKKDVK